MLPESIAARLQALQEARRGLAEGLTSPNTRRGYGYDFRSFATFCKSLGLPPLPAAAETVALYVADALGRHKVSTVSRRLAAVAYVHRARGCMRAGFCTEAGERNCGELLIAAQTGHTDMATLRRYFRRRDVFRSNACASLGL